MDHRKSPNQPLDLSINNSNNETAARGGSEKFSSNMQNPHGDQMDSNFNYLTGYPESPSQPLDLSISKSNDEETASGSLGNVSANIDNSQDLPSNPEQIDNRECSSEFSMPSTSSEVHIQEPIPLSQAGRAQFNDQRPKHIGEINQKCGDCKKNVSLKRIEEVRSEEFKNVKVTFCLKCNWKFWTKKPSESERCSSCKTSDWRNVITRNKKIDKKCNVCQPIPEVVKQLMNIKLCDRCFDSYNEKTIFSKNSDGEVIKLCQSCNWDTNFRRHHKKTK